MLNVSFEMSSPETTADEETIVFLDLCISDDADEAHSIRLYEPLDDFLSSLVSTILGLSVSTKDQTMMFFAAPVYIDFRSIECTDNRIDVCIRESRKILMKTETKIDYLLKLLTSVLDNYWSRNGFFDQNLSLVKDVSITLHPGLFSKS